MKTVINKTPKPIRIRLGGGKVLHLGPSKTGQIADDAAEGSSVRRLVEAGEIEVVDDAAATQRGGASRAGGQADTRGHHPTTIVHTDGNR